MIILMILNKLHFHEKVLNLLQNAGSHESQYCMEAIRKSHLVTMFMFCACMSAQSKQEVLKMVGS